MQLRIEAVQSTNPSPVRTASSAIPTNGDDPVAGCGRISIGADRNGDYASDFYNGKIEAPSIYPTAATHDLPGAQRDSSEFTKGPLAAWAFEIGIDGWSITDTSGAGFDGHAINMPMRGATGRNFDGTETAWLHAPSHYGAIHFHDDDLFDAGWDPSFSWRVPADLKSGVLRGTCVQRIQPRLHTVHCSLGNRRSLR